MGVILHPPLPSNVVLDDLIEADSIFRNVTDLKSIQEKIEGPTNMTLLILNNEAEGKLFHTIRTPRMNAHSYIPYMLRI